MQLPLVGDGEPINLSNHVLPRKIYIAETWNCKMGLEPRHFHMR